MVAQQQICSLVLLFSTAEAMRKLWTSVIITIVFIFIAIAGVATIVFVNKRSSAKQNDNEMFGSPYKDFHNSTYQFLNISFVRIPVGSFLMGSSSPLPDTLTGGLPYRIQGDLDEKPWHNVSIMRNIFVSETVITNKQFKQFKPNHVSDPYGFSTGDDDAVVMVQQVIMSF